MPDILAAIDRAANGLCPCGAEPAEGSAYCSDDCRPTHISGDTDTRMSGDLATPMRWRPDLVTEADDSHLLPLGSETHGYTGPYRAQLFERTDRPGTWHLRLDDGHRYVGMDLAEVGGRQDGISVELVGRIGEAWRRLERELGNTRHLVADDDPWADVMDRYYWRSAPNHAHIAATRIPPRARDTSPFTWRRLCRSCERHGEPIIGQRVAAPSALRDWLGYEVQTEVCQVCPDCRTPYPGPPLTPAVERNLPFDAWDVRLWAMVDGERYGITRQVSESDLRVAEDLAEHVQETWDRLERDLLRHLAQRTPGGVATEPSRPIFQPSTSLSSLNHLFGIPVVLDPAIPPGVAEIRDTANGGATRIHVRDRNFEFTPEQQEEIRRRFHEVQQRAEAALRAFNENFGPALQRAADETNRFTQAIQRNFAATFDGVDWQRLGQIADDYRTNATDT